MAFLSLKFNPQAMRDYLKEEIPEFAYLNKCINDYIVAQNDWGTWEKIEKTLELIGCVVKNTTALMEEGWTVDRAIDVGATAVDKLLDFSGIIGGLVEGFDDTICKVLLKAAYELVRDRKHLTKDEFVKSAVKEVKKATSHK